MHHSSIVNIPYLVMLSKVWMWLIRLRHPIQIAMIDPLQKWRLSPQKFSNLIPELFRVFYKKLLFFFPYTISTPENESYEKIVWIFSKFSSRILKLVHDSYHEEIIGEIEYTHNRNNPFRISYLSCFEESKGKSINMYHREKELLIVYRSYFLVFFTPEKSDRVVYGGR